MLWSFAPTNPAYTNSGSTPQGSKTGLDPSGDAIVPMPSLSPDGSSKSIVNVVRDYYWTYSPVGDKSRAEVPRIQLVERRLKTNALVAQLQYTLGAASTTLTKLGSEVRGGSYIAGLIKGIGNGAATAAEGAANALGINTEAGKQAITDSNTTTKDSPFLQPYKGLYITEETGWIYTLPYFDNNHSTSTNQFSDTAEGVGSIAPKVGEWVQDLSTNLGVLASPTQYTFIEKTKFYNYSSDSGESIKVEFPLINTGAATYDDVIKNWQFLYLLVYQNRPGRTGYNTVDQPVIYEVTVPGTKFFPYCYISNLTVEFVGSRREMSLAIPSVTSSVNQTQTSVSNNTQTSNINAIIPDAYNVSITLQSMTANTKNFMAHMVQTPSVIQTGTGTSNNFTNGEALNNAFGNVTSPNPFQSTGLGPIR